jgi:hypothetical protein
LREKRKARDANAGVTPAESGTQPPEKEGDHKAGPRDHEDEDNKESTKNRDRAGKPQNGESKGSGRERAEQESDNDKRTDGTRDVNIEAKSEEEIHEGK